MTTTSTYSLQTVGMEFTANTFTPSDQMLPDVLALSNGGYVVAYNNHDSADGYILLDFYDADSRLTQTSVRAPYDTLAETSAYGAPTMTQLGDGNVLVAWSNLDPGNLGVKAAIFTPNGEKIGAELTLAYSQGTKPHLSTLSNGEYVLSLLHEHQGGHVFSLLDNPENPLNWHNNNAPVDVAAGNAVFNPTSAALANGGYVVAWSSTPGGVATTQLHARVYNQNDEPATSELTLDSYGLNYAPSIAALPNGNWAVAYTDTGWANEGGSTGISLKILTPTGSTVSGGGAIHVNPPSPFADSAPSITALDNNYVLVTWNRETAPGTYDIYGRLFNQWGDPITIGASTDAFLVSSPAGNDIHPDVAALGAGKFVTAWQSTSFNGADIAVHVQEIIRFSGGDGANDTIVGDALRDIVTAGAGNDTIDGRAGNDLINGEAGNDTVIGGFGNDTLDGGADDDTAVFGGNRADYRVTQLATGDIQVVDMRPGSPDGTDIVRAVEHFAFANTTVSAAAVLLPPSVHWSASTDIGTHPAGWQPSLTGDFNGDGTSDALWFNAATNNVDIWSIQNGQWAGSSDVGAHPAGWQPSAAGDFNGDGTDDVLWFNPATNHVDIWTMANGHWAGSSDVGPHPPGYTVAGAGDFNNDGTSDVLWYNAATGDTEVWMLANGQWSASVNIGPHPPGWQPAGVGDFNRDGTSDVLWHNPTTNDAEVWMISNGQWAGSVNIGSHPAGYHVAAVGDFARDGTSDVLWYNPSTGDVDLWKIVDGHWAGSDTIGLHPAGWTPAGAGDFNHDGIADVLWGNAAGNHLETWLLGNS